MKKVLLEGAMFAENHLMGKNRSGLGRVAEEMTWALFDEQKFDFYFANFFYMQNYHDNLKHYILNNYPHLIEKLVSNRPSIIFEPLKFKALWLKYPELMIVPVKTKPLKEFDLIHSFYYPFTNKVQNNKLKKCITFYDIVPIVMGRSPFFIKERTEKIVKDIEHNYAIAISEFSKNDLLNYNKNIDPERVFVSHLAASKTTFFRNIDKDKWAQVKNKYQLPEQYFFCVAANDPRKNIVQVVKSFNKFINQEKRKDIYLLLAGNSAHGNAIISQLELSKETISRIVTPQIYIDEVDLSVIYSNALCFIYMSEYEGFGLPVLEAMQCGTPTISANATSIPEVVGEAGIMLSPFDEDGLAENMSEIYENKTLRDQLSKLGLKRSEKFSWKKAANDYNQIFEKIINW